MELITKNYQRDRYGIYRLLHCTILHDSHFFSHILSIIKILYCRIVHIKYFLINMVSICFYSACTRDCLKVGACHNEYLLIIPSINHYMLHHVRLYVTVHATLKCLYFSIYPYKLQHVTVTL
jgi:hypothetical protein